MGPIIAPPGRVPSIPAGVGVGAVDLSGGGEVIKGPGTYDISALGVPGGRDVLVTMWGGGGGGGGDDDGGGNGSGGGGSGGYVQVRVTAAVWVLGGSLVVGAPGGGGSSAGGPGDPGENTVLTINAIQRALAGAGLGGSAALPFSGGGHNANAISGTVTTVTNTAGVNGAAGSALGPGGDGGDAPGGGAGGAGALVAGGVPGDGTAPGGGGGGAADGNTMQGGAAGAGRAVVSW